jgi:hypothetical protein
VRPPNLLEFSSGCDGGRNLKDFLHNLADPVADPPHLILPPSADHHRGGGGPCGARMHLQAGVGTAIPEAVNEPARPASRAEIGGDNKRRLSAGWCLAVCRAAPSRSCPESGVSAAGGSHAGRIRTRPRLDQDFYTLAELAKWLWVSGRHIQRFRAVGEGPPAIRLGRAD